MKYLIVNGCSFSAYTYGRIFDSEFNFNLQQKIKQWPIILAEKLGMKLINLALGGAGNEGILSRTSDVLAEIDPKDIGLVCHMWTESKRRDYTAYNALKTAYDLGDPTNPEKNMVPHQGIGNHKFFDDIKDLSFLNSSWCGHFHPPGSYEDWISNSLRQFYLFQTICESYGVPYIQFQGLNLFWNHYKMVEMNKTLFSLNKSKFTRDEDENKFTGEARSGAINFYEQYDTLPYTKQTIPYPFIKEINCHNYVKRDKKELNQIMKNNMYYDKIKNFINWPIDEPNENIDWTTDDLIEYKNPIEITNVMKRYGFDSSYEIENNIQQRFLRFNQRNESWLWPDNSEGLQDWHPNQETQHKIADYVYENI